MFKGKRWPAFMWPRGSFSGRSIWRKCTGRPSTMKSQQGVPTLLPQNYTTARQLSTDCLTWQGTGFGRATHLTLWRDQQELEVVDSSHFITFGWSVPLVSMLFVLLKYYLNLWYYSVYFYIQVSWNFWLITALLLRLIPTLHSNTHYQAGIVCWQTTKDRRAKERCWNRYVHFNALAVLPLFFFLCCFSDQNKLAFE